MTKEDRTLALEAVKELERLGEVASSVAKAVPAIIHSGRQDSHRQIYEDEAEHWFRLAKAVKACAERVDILEEDDWQDHCGDKGCHICGEFPENKDQL